MRLIPNCLHVKLLIGLNEMTKIPKVVPFWLVQGFDAKYEELEVIGFERHDVEIDTDMRVLGAQASAQLGEIAATGQAVFEVAYGPGTTGLRALLDLVKRADTITEADIVLSGDIELDLDESIRLDDEPAAPAPTPAKPKDGAKGKAPSGDGAGNVDPLAGDEAKG